MTRGYSDDHSEWIPTSHGGTVDPWSSTWARPHIPKAKVLLANSKHPHNRMEALFNPAELNIRVRAQAGRLHPVGWSHPIKQYAYTEEAAFPLNFLFTRLALHKFGGATGRKKQAEIEGAPRAGIKEPVAWLTSFCYGERVGVAPAPMLIVWPNMLTMQVTVDSVQEQWRRFAPDLSPVEVMVTVNFSELRVQFKQSGNHMAGWEHPYDDALGGTLATSWVRTARTRMGGAGK